MSAHLVKTFQRSLFSEVVMKGSSENDFDFVLTASRTESQRKLRVPGEVAPVGRMSFEVEIWGTSGKTIRIQESPKVNVQEIILKYPYIIFNTSRRCSPDLHTAQWARIRN